MMNSVLLPTLLVALITTFARAESIDNLDLRVVSQLRVELRNIGQLHDQCEWFWKGLSGKLDENGITQASRDATLRQLKSRLKNLRYFEKLAEFIDKCISDSSEGEPTAADDRVKVLEAKLNELERLLKAKDENIRQLTLDNQQQTAPREQIIEAKESDNDECSRVYKEQLEVLQNEMKQLRAELGTKDDKLERMRQSRKAAIEKLNELAKTLGGHASHLVQEKDFAEQQVKELRNSLANSERKLKSKQEQVDKLNAKVLQLESELHRNDLEISRMRKELEARSRQNLDDLGEQKGRRVIKIRVQ